jgi:hypothetical protein
MPTSCVRIQLSTGDGEPAPASPPRPQIRESELSPRELEQLRRFRMRRGIALLSLRATQERLDAAIDEQIVAWNLYHEAIVVCAPDDDDSFEAAAEKAEKLAHYEERYLRAGLLAETITARTHWELAEAKRLGVLKG